MFTSFFFFDMFCWISRMASEDSLSRRLTFAPEFEESCRDNQPLMFRLHFTSTECAHTALACDSPH